MRKLKRRLRLACRRLIARTILFVLLEHGPKAWRMYWARWIGRSLTIPKRRRFLNRCFGALPYPRG